MQSIKASDYHDIVTVSDPRLSPDSEHIAFVRTVSNGDESVESTINLVPADSTGTMRQFTTTEDVDAEPRWSPSGDRLAFTTTRGLDDRIQLWVIPTDGGEARRVTNVPGSVSDPSWSRDGRRIAFVQSVTADERDEGHDLEKAGSDERETPDPRVLD